MFCPGCGERIDEQGARFCPVCGSKLPEAQSADETVRLNEPAPDMDAAFAPQTPEPADDGRPKPPSQTVAMPAAAAAPVAANVPVMDAPAANASVAGNAQPVATTQAPQPAPQQNGGKKKVGLIVGIIAAVLVIAALIAGLFLSGVVGGPKEHKVAFETGGGSTIAAQTIAEGDQLTSPAAPTRDGYVFEGWYLDAGYTVPASMPMVVTEDTTLFAKWAEAPKEDTSSNNSGSQQVPSVIVVTPQGFGTRDITDVYDGSDYSRYEDSVYVECQAKSGGTVSGWVTRRSGEYVIPDSSSYTYSKSELAALGLNDAELCIAWNEPFARKGYHFSNSSLQNYFESCSWYHDSGKKPNLSSGSAGYKNGEKLKSLLGNSKWRSLVEY